MTSPPPVAGRVLTPVAGLSSKVGFMAILDWAGSEAAINACVATGAAKAATAPIINAAPATEPTTIPAIAPLPSFPSLEIRLSGRSGGGGGGGDEELVFDEDEEFP
jgi:hypothetical protein